MGLFLELSQLNSAKRAGSPVRAGLQPLIESQEVDEMNRACQECHRVLNGSRDYVKILSCPVESDAKGCSTVQHESKKLYVPPEYRNLTLLNVSSKTRVDDSASVMYTYGDSERAGYRIYGISLS